MTGSFVARQLQAKFQYGTGAEGEGAFKTLQLRDLRMSARVVAAGGISMGELNLNIWGMTLAQMNELSTLGTKIQLVRRNFVTLLAGDAEGGFSQVYEGTIYSAWADLNSAADVVFRVIAHAGLFENMAPVAASSYPGAADVAVVMADLAGKMGLGFENGGVTGVTLQSPYFPGTGRQQAARCAQAAGINWVIDNGTLSIWPQGGARPGSNVLISAATGMVGSPQFTANGLLVKMLFNKALRFGTTATVQSTVVPPQVNGKQWRVATLAHDLECQLPGGAWFTEALVVPPEFVAVTR